MPATIADFQDPPLEETGAKVNTQWPALIRSVQSLAVYFQAKFQVGSAEPNDVLQGLAFGDGAGDPARLHYRLFDDGVDFKLQENTGTDASPTWTDRSTLNSPVLDHGSLTGLGDDDHTQYVLALGTRNIDNLADASLEWGLDAGVSAGQQIDFVLQDRGTTEFTLRKTAGNITQLFTATGALELYSDTNTHIKVDGDAFTFEKSGAGTASFRINGGSGVVVQEVNFGGNASIGRSSIGTFGFFGSGASPIVVMNESSPANTIFILSSGNVGINTNAPTQRLHVQGNILANRFRGNNTGSVASPTFRWEVDANTGIYNPAEDRMGLVAGGVAQAEIDVSGLLMQAGAIRILSGSAGSPSLQFTLSGTTGLYRVSADTIGLSAAGVLRAQVDSSGLRVNSGTLRLQDGAGTAPSLTYNSQTSLGLYRAAADQMQVSDGDVLNDADGFAMDGHPAFSAYGPASNTTITSATTIPLDGATVTEETGFTLNTAGTQLTIDVTGLFAVTIVGSVRQSTALRSVARFFLERDEGGTPGFVFVPGMECFAYSRDNADGHKATASNMQILSLNSGDILRLRGDRESGTGTIQALQDACGVHIWKIR